MDQECEYGNCGSRGFHVGDDGYTYCTEGHRQFQSGLVTAEEDDAPSIGRKALRQREDETTTTVLSGRQAVEHYLVCFQLILWKQVHWVVHHRGYPAELEIIVRDLWTLRLQSLQDKFEEGEDEAEHFFSSQAEPESTEDDNNSSQSKKQQNNLPGCYFGICLIYLGLLLLRIPVLCADIERWIASGELIFYRATRVMDTNMRDRLPGRYHKLLNPQQLLRTEMLHEYIQETISLYNTEFGMTTPPLNHQLCLYRLVQDLSLPLEVYAATLRLANILDVRFDFDNQSSKKQRLIALRSPETRLASIMIIATRLLFPFDGRERTPRKPTELAALGLDWSTWSKARIPRSELEHTPDMLSFDEGLRTSEKDVMHMPEDKLDQYMDWYQSMFVEEQPREIQRFSKEVAYRRALQRMFPIDRHDVKKLAQSPDNQEDKGYDLKRSTAEQSLKTVQSSLRPVRILSDEAAEEAYATIIRPGDLYKRYRKVEELVGHAKIFYEAITESIGGTTERLVQAVFALEIRLEQQID